MVEAGLLEAYDFENEDYLTKRFPALLSLNSRRMLKFVVAYLADEEKAETEEERLMLNLFYYTIYRSAPANQGFEDIDDGIRSIVACQDFKDEILDILKYNSTHIDFVDKRNELPYACPLDLHCKYSTDQVLSAFGYWNGMKRRRRASGSV